MIIWANESVWLYTAPENKSGSLWFIFHGSVNLPYILKAIWYINMITWAYESVWFDAWPQNKNGSLWPIFHGSVILAYILKTILCIRRWHWPGVYVSPCSLALVSIMLDGVTLFSRIKNLWNTCECHYYGRSSWWDFFSHNGGKLETSEGYTYLLVVSCMLESK